MLKRTCMLGTRGKLPQLVQSQNVIRIGWASTVLILDVSVWGDWEAEFQVMWDKRTVTEKTNKQTKKNQLLRMTWDHSCTFFPGTRYYIVDQKRDSTVIIISDWRIIITFGFSLELEINLCLKPHETGNFHYIQNSWQTYFNNFTMVKMQLHILVHLTCTNTSHI